MTVADLIQELKKYPENMPITIDGCIDFSETVGNTIRVSKQEYICFPFTQNDRFSYINLEIADKEYWNILKGAW